MRERTIAVSVTSEVGRLRRVIVHEPGLEIERMTPDMRHEFLFDDTLYLRYARGEHRRFIRLLRTLGVEVLEFQDLLRDTLAHPGAREYVPGLVDQIVREEGVPDAPALYADLLAGPGELATRLIEGIEYAHTDLPRLLGGQFYRLRPLPNLMYMRDLAAVIHDRVLVGHLAPDAGTRRRETQLLNFVFSHHPAFATTNLWFTPPPPLAAPPPADPEGAYFEGGALLMLNAHTLLIGANRRTTTAGVRLLADGLSQWCARQGRVLTIYLVRLTEAEHARGGEFLDSVFAILNRGEYLIYPPVFSPKGPEVADVVRIRIDAHGQQHRVRLERLWEAFDADPLLRPADEPIFCGGEDEVFQKREQWFGAVNTLVVAPGKVVIYSSAERTIREMRRRGYTVVDAGDLLEGRRTLDLDDGRNVVITIHGAELARGHGGPHSLVLPLARDPLPGEGGVG
jgi:arginine deiminase